MTDGPDALDMTDNVGVRLHGVEFPNGRDAVVTFELFSWRSGNGGQNRSLLKLPLATQRLLNEDESIDYAGIVQAAASKLKQEFGRVSTTLSERHCAC